MPKMTKAMVGLPYARQEWDAEGSFYELCPVCGMHCPETLDCVGEQIKGTYAQHYVEAHPSEYAAWIQSHGQAIAQT
jgi:hypothetical protein